MTRERREGRESLSQEFAFPCLCSLLGFPHTPLSLKGQLARLKPETLSTWPGLAKVFGTSAFSSCSRPVWPLLLSREALRL